MLQSARAILSKQKRIGIIATALNGATSTTPRITIPATAQVGDQLFFLLSLNNTDNITATPTGVVLIDSNATVAAFPAKLYRATVNTTSLAAGTLLQWTLSASRAWATAGILLRGVDQTSPVIGFTPAASAVATAVMPSLTIATPGLLLEIGAGKGNGTAITAWSEASPTFGIEVVSPSVSGFAGSIFVADNGTGALSPIGTYGGETYTPDQAAGATVRYTMAVKAA